MSCADPLYAFVIQGVRVLKFYTWERFFSGEVEGHRREELGELLTQNFLKASVTFSIVGVPLLVTLSSFGLYSALGNQLTSEKAFPALSLFNALVFAIIQPYLFISVWDSAQTRTFSYVA
jgi:hypothetical protein